MQNPVKAVKKISAANSNTGIFINSPIAKGLRDQKKTTIRAIKV